LIVEDEMKNNIAIVLLSLAVVVLGILLLVPKQQNQKNCEPEGKHKAYHEGSLNAITQCENGHFEIKVVDDSLEGWFVGGGQDTNRAVRVSSDKIELTVFLPDGTNKELLLTASPLNLAGEKNGDCSHFTAAAPWLSDIKTFQATGKINFKGKWQPLIIQYPEGYDRD